MSEPHPSPNEPAPPLAIRELRLKNLLSFGADTGPIALGPLNVLIGPNGSGKSNLVDIIHLLRHLPADFKVPIRKGGGGREWLWKGGAASEAHIEIVMELRAGAPAIQYLLGLRVENGSLELGREKLSAVGGKCLFNAYDSPGDAFIFDAYTNDEVTIADGRWSPEEPVFEQFRDPYRYPEITDTADHLSSFRFYRQWQFGPDAPVRRPQPADLPNDHLLEDGSNLGLILNKLRKSSATKRRLVESVRAVYAPAEDVDVIVEGGTVQVFIQEHGYSTPATRLSDGTLHWLSLLAILLDPSPPPLVCIEEPEVGLHPDLIHVLVGLLRDASTRMQLLVTTHSDILVDALSDTPEAVLVCERPRGPTELRRLAREDLAEWIEKYSLGELWRKGEFGGNRW